MVTKINDTQKQNLLNNRYIIEEKIGDGYTSEVYKVLDQRN